MQGADICKGQGDPAVTLTCPRLPGPQCGRRHSVSTPGSRLEDMSLETWSSSRMTLSRNILGRQTREAFANGILWVEARDAAEHPSEHRIDPRTVAYINVSAVRLRKATLEQCPIPHAPGNFGRLSLGSPLDNLVPLETTCPILSVTKQDSLFYQRDL